MRNHKGSNNPNWKGNKVNYSGLHTWVRKRKQKPKYCEVCNLKPAKDLANISQEYKRDINDFKWVCGRICNNSLRKKVNKDNKCLCKKLAKCKEYYIKNKGKILTYQKKYYENHQDEVVGYHKIWYNNNKKKILTYQKKYRENNKEKISAQKKEYYQNNKNKIKIRERKYYLNNKNKINARHRDYNKVYRINNKEKITKYQKKYRGVKK